MKDSMGSAVLINIFVIFIVIFIIFMAAIINYTKTYRIKNQIINIIDRYEGYKDTAPTEIEEYISAQRANVSCAFATGITTTRTYNGDSKCYIDEVPVTGGGHYYKVTVFVTVELPIIKSELTLPVRGDTKIYRDNVPGNLESLTINEKNEEDNPKPNTDLDVEDGPSEPTPETGGPCSFEQEDNDNWALCTPEPVYVWRCPSNQCRQYSNNGNCISCGEWWYKKFSHYRYCKGIVFGTLKTVHGYCLSNNIRSHVQRCEGRVGGQFYSKIIKRWTTPC